MILWQPGHSHTSDCAIYADPPAACTCGTEISLEAKPDRQYVAIRFRARATRTYTYHNDGPAVAPGDQVRVKGRDGWQWVEVVSVTDEKPPYETKPILPPAETE